MGFRLANIADRAALVMGDDYFDLEQISGGAVSADPMVAIGQGDAMSALYGQLADHSPTGQLSSVTLGAPSPRPQKSFGVGLNYADHAAETSMEVPNNPLVFTKFPSCIVGPTADVEIRSDGCDYEGELLVVIGKGGKDIPLDDAWDHIAGLSIGQDVSDRPAQFAAKPPHFDLGKSFDTFGPCGPLLVSPDLIDDRSSLRIITKLNGEVRQDDTTASMIFDVPTLVSYLSRITTLVTGDIIFSGTPEGIGWSQETYLADGDIITTTIEGIGTMTNRCVRVSDY